MKYEPEAWRVAYQTNGFVVVQDLLDTTTLSRLRDDLTRIIANPESLPPSLKEKLFFEREHVKNNPQWYTGILTPEECGLAVRQIEDLALFDASFAELIEYPQYDEDDDDDDLPGYPGWEATIVRQIVDLREMDEAGMLKNKYKYFGVDSPRGERWYNFNPASFLECAMAGTYGGWSPGDSTGRTYVPGKVAFLDENGELVDRDPETLPNPIYPIAQISWEDFQYFLSMGQMYE
ncbi:MAG: hypothetical protein J2P31_01655 [Blastocatellia bacterium]|nr:hypothetical protein [Blastocatellia bacterium]